MKMNLSFILLLFAQLAFGQISDPNGVLSQVENYFSENSFERVFHSSISFESENTDCIAKAHCDSFVSLGQSSYDRALGQAEVQYLKSGTKKIVAQYTLNKSDWSLARFNFLYKHIKNVNSFGMAVTVDSYEESTREVQVNGQSVVLPVIVVKWAAENQMKQGSKFVSVLTNALPSVAQYILVVEDKKGLVPSKSTRLVKNIRCSHPEFRACTTN